MKNTIKILSLLIVICVLFSSCAQANVEVIDNISNIKANSVSENQISNTEIANHADVEQLSALNSAPEKRMYKEGVILVKSEEAISDTLLAELDLASATALYNGSSWYSVELKADADTEDTVNAGERFIGFGKMVHIHMFYHNGMRLWLVDGRK